MKEYFYSLNSHKAGFRLMISSIICILILLLSVIPAQAAKGGWIEVTSDVPDDLNSYIILSVINEDTYDEYDISVLPDNDFYARKEVPLGNYSVAAAWVFQDYRYEVTPNVSSFKVDDNAAADIKLSVKAPTQESPTDEPPISEEDPEDTFLVETITGTIDTALDATTESEDDSTEKTEQVEDEKEEISLLLRILIFVVGTAFFAGIIFAIVYFARKHFIE